MREKKRQREGVRERSSIHGFTSLAIMAAKAGRSGWLSNVADICNKK